MSRGRGNPGRRVVCMVVGILQFEIIIRGAESLKDKRRVVQSLKDRLHRDHQASVAEVGPPDVMTSAVLGLAIVGNDGRHIGQTLDRILAKIPSMGEGELGASTRRLIHGHASEIGEPVAAGDEDLAEEMLKRGEDAAGEALA